MRKHLKQIAAPRTWQIARQPRQWILRPQSSGHPFSSGLPLGVVLRDQLQLASTHAEVQKLLRAQQVLVDGRRRTDPHFLVGLFDVLSFPLLQKTYRMVLGAKGRITVTEIPSAESAIKPGKVLRKTMTKQGKVQYTLHDGKNILTSERAAVGDTLVLQLPHLKVSSLLALKPGVQVLLTEGKHAGQLGVLKELTGTTARYVLGRKAAEPGVAETARKYLFVVGEKTPVVTVR